MNKKEVAYVEDFISELSEMVDLTYQKIIDGKDFNTIRDEEIQNLESKNIKVEYLEHRTNTTLNPAKHDISDTSIFIACFIDNVRLIDNTQI